MAFTSPPASVSYTHLQVMEFTGEGAGTFSVNDRMVLCNLAVEAGAKTGIFEADEAALKYLRERGREPKTVFTSDPDAVYVRELSLIHIL